MSRDTREESTAKVMNIYIERETRIFMHKVSPINKFATKIQNVVNFSHNVIIMLIVMYYYVNNRVFIIMLNISFM